MQRVVVVSPDDTGITSARAKTDKLEFLEAEIAAVERLIAQQALSWPEIRRLMTVPG